MYKEINEAADYLRKRGVKGPEIGIILGTGLGKLADYIEPELEIDYEEIPHFPVSTVEFHHGILIYGKLRGKRVLVMKGRSHVYEGYSTQQITFPVRVMKMLGIRCLLVSNAGGAMNTEFKKGSLMLIEDHINLLPNPLVGQNIDELGPRFPDMSQAYSKEISGKMIRIAEKHGITLHRGIYVAVTGPNLETKAEYRFLRRIGADVVGMSTTPEVIVANHMKLPVAAISVVTDECDPDHLEPVDIEKILYYASQAENGLVKIFSDLVEEL
jgi:purine-nucleoside phosphorylase